MFLGFQWHRAIMARVPELEFDGHLPVLGQFSRQIWVKIKQNRLTKCLNIFLKRGFDVLHFFQNVMISGVGAGVETPS